MSSWKHLRYYICDNISAVMVAHNLILHARIKHIELDIHFVCKKVDVNKLVIQHIHGSLQVADALTKPLSHTIFHDSKSKLKLVPLVQL